MCMLMNFRFTRSFIICACLVVLATLQSAAQDKATIRGVVKDSASGKAISYATAGLYRTIQQEKAVMNLFTNDKGEFVFTQVDTGNYVVIVTHASYSEKISAVITVTASIAITVEPMLVSEAPTQLAGVTVSTSTSRRPLLERQEDKIIFNAEADPTLDGQQATDVLRKTPFLSVDNDGNVLLNGQSNFKILLNGKESSMFSKDPKEVLKSFPASLIKKIEVLTQPSAKYDAEGFAGVINIITKKKILGYNGTANIFANTIGNRNFNSTFNAKYGQLGFSSYIGFGGNPYNPGHSETVTNSTNPIAYKQRLLYGNSVNNWSWGNINGELTYDIDSLNTLSSYINTYTGSNENIFEQESYLIRPAGDTTKGILNSNSFNRYPSFDWGTDYIRKFAGNSEKEFTFRVNGRHGNDKDDVNSQQYQEGFQRLAMNTNRSGNNEYTLQADLIIPWKNKKKFEIGAKYIMRRADAIYDALLSYSPDTKFFVDSSNSNHFNYYQNVASAYVTYGFYVKKYFFKLGVRSERSELGGDFESGEALVKQTFFNIVPTLYVSKNLKDNQTVTFNYSMRLQRPYIWDLNPFVNNADSLNIRFGNPNLRPQLIHNVEFGYSLFKGQNTANIKLGGFYSNNQITQYSLFDAASGITSTTRDNIGLNYGVSLNGYLSIKPVQWLLISSNFGLRYDVVINKTDKSMRNQGLGGNANINTSIDFSKKSGMVANAGMWQGNINLQGRQGLQYWYGAGGFVKLLNNKLRLTLRLNNFLQNEMLIWKRVSKGPDFNTQQSIYSRGRSIGLGLSWTFGKLTDNVSKKKGVANDDVAK
jgi:outer membrane receptor for ferrienterochelin and colicin